MRKTLLFIIFLSALCVTAFAQEQLTITTFYPSPNGSYNQLQTQRLGVGDTNRNGVFNVNDVPVTNGDAWIRGNVGIGTNTTEFRLTLDKGAPAPDGGILAIGTFGSGAALTTAGAGTRLIWYPRKGAFRVGQAVGNEWDDAQIGSNSVATGYYTNASGAYSTAMGYVANATGIVSTAMGYRTIASGNIATAMGDETIASGTTSTTMGMFTRASGWVSTAMGYGTTASGWHSTAMGVYSNATGVSSTAMGQLITVSGQGSVGIGLDAVPSTVSANNVMAIMGGKVGIGTTTPEAKLEIMQPMTTWDSGLQITGPNAKGQLTTGNGFLAMRSTGTQGINFCKSNGLLLVKITDNGGVGIGDALANPGSKLTVAGNMAVGAGFAGFGAPTNGAIIQGPVYLGPPIASIPVNTELAVNGDQYLQGSLRITGAIIGDVGEDIDCPGCGAADVVVIDPMSNRTLKKSTQAYDYTVAGVVSTKPTLHIGRSDSKDAKPLALVGQVQCKVTSENGPIKRGDPLVTSSKPGYAMRADLDKVKPGMIIGKALEPLEQGDGIIVVLIAVN